MHLNSGYGVLDWIGVFVGVHFPGRGIPLWQFGHGVDGVLCFICCVD
jgi:hypothetical protein